MNIVESIILGIIQGLTEFLPVSSSGHIELGKVLLDVHVKDPLLFSIVVHAATALSTIVIFFKDILQMIKDLVKFEWNPSTQFATMILVSMVPVGIVGILFEDQINSLFDGNVLLVGAMLLVTGGLLWYSSRAKVTEGELNFPKALIIGISQAIAILPGISRSGSTISTALLLGVDRATAASFSFLMVLPPILGATALKVKDYFELMGGESGDLAASGFLAAFVSGLIACNWMIRLVRQSKLDYFAIYCFIVGIIAIVAGLMQ
ncbi:UNVERIFIED_CONTAM: hypothetical protein GTU68_062176 [Idotea baltica]|nr:hypothetical protein [Idotea baltica]